MIVKKIMKIERLTRFVFSFALIFGFSGMFFFVDGKTYLSNVLVGASLIGILAFLFNREPVGIKNRDILWVILCYAAFLFLNRQIHGDQYGIMRAIIYVACFALVIPRHIDLLKSGCFGIILGGLGLGAISIWQYNHGVVRAEGFTNAIIFAQAALTLAILNWFVYVNVSKNTLEKTLPIMSAISALIALYLSQSRGVWLALITVIACWLLYKMKRRPLKYISITLVMSLMLGILCLNSGMVKSRIDAGVSDIENMDNGNYSTSLGLRVVAWKSAWLGFVDSPLMGVGTDGFDALKQEQVKQDLVPQALLNPDLAHAHNQYLQTLVIRGGVGFIFLLGMFLLPAIFFAKKMGFVSAGVFIPISFAVGAISDVPFEHQSMIYLYSLSLIFILFFHELKQDLS